MRSSPRPRYRPTARVSVLDIVPGARFSLHWRAMLGAVIDSLPMALTHALDQPVRCRHGFIHRSARCVATAQCEDTDDKQQEANGYMRRHTFVRRGGKQEPHLHRYIDRKRDVWGKSVAVRVDLGSSR